MMTGVSLVLPADGGTPLPETSPWWPIKLIAFPPSVDVMSLRFCSQAPPDPDPSPSTPALKAASLPQGAELGQYMCECLLC